MCNLGSQQAVNFIKEKKGTKSFQVFVTAKQHIRIMKLSLQTELAIHANLFVWKYRQKKVSGITVLLIKCSLLGYRQLCSKHHVWLLHWIYTCGVSYTSGFSAFEMTCYV